MRARGFVHAVNRCDVQYEKRGRRGVMVGFKTQQTGVLTALSALPKGNNDRLMS